MRSEPGHTWGGSTLSGQRLQEPALLGLPMYEAHRSWRLPGQCRAAIIMSAARNRIWYSPALLLACAGPSLRLAVTAHFAAAFTTQDAAAIPWPALPVLRCPQRSSEHSASCGCWRCAPGRFHAMPVAQSVLGGARCVAHQQADSRQSVEVADISLRPAHKRNSPAKTRFTKAKK